MKKVQLWSKYMGCLLIALSMVACGTSVADVEDSAGTIGEEQEAMGETLKPTEKPRATETPKPTQAPSVQYDNPFELERFTEILLMEYARGVLTGDNIIEPPADLVFPEYTWCKYEFVGDDNGIYTVEIPSADGNYIIKLTIDGSTGSKLDESEMSPWLMQVEFLLK